MKKFLKISKEMKLFMYNYANWIFLSVCVASWILNEIIIWEVDNTTGNMMTTFVSSVTILIYSIAADFINYKKIDTSIDRVAKHSEMDLYADYFAYASLRETVRELSNNEQQFVGISRFRDIMVKKISEKNIKYKEAENMVWENSYVSR